VNARAIHIDDGEAKIVGAQRESGRDGEVINGMVSKIEQTFIPSGKDASRGAN
jgi:hypothetical protein